MDYAAECRHFSSSVPRFVLVELLGILQKNSCPSECRYSRESIEQNGLCCAGRCRVNVWERHAREHVLCILLDNVGVYAEWPRFRLPANLHIWAFDQVIEVYSWDAKC